MTFGGISSSHNDNESAVKKNGNCTKTEWDEKHRTLCRLSHVIRITPEQELGNKQVLRQQNGEKKDKFDGTIRIAQKRQAVVSDQRSKPL
jgi:hypothetical protein